MLLWCKLTTHAKGESTAFVLISLFGSCLKSARTICLPRKLYLSMSKKRITASIWGSARGTRMAIFIKYTEKAYSRLFEGNL